MKGEHITIEEIETYQELLKRILFASSYPGVPKDRELSTSDFATVASLQDFLEKLKSYLVASVAGEKNDGSIGG